MIRKTFFFHSEQVLRELQKQIPCLRQAGTQYRQDLRGGRNDK